MNKFDIIIIGGGHAGIEATYAASKLMNNILLITLNIDTIAQLSCNPSIGGIGKSQLVKEIDALGGLIGRAANYSGIHFKLLNKSKGAAVQSTRIQVDRNQYKKYILNKIMKKKNITILQQEATDFILDKDNNIIGIKTKIGLNFFCKSIVLTLGTFLNGLIHIGDIQEKSGRMSEYSCTKIKDFFTKNNIETKRFKTGTPPRLDKRTINYNLLEIQDSELNLQGLSFYKNINWNLKKKKLIKCYITHTNENTHNIIKKNIQFSLMYSNKDINSTGPRYCPSIEDKITKFIDKNSHQIFLEPEGNNYLEIYPNGISTSLPYKIQIDFIKTIKGLENVFITKPGYAIEYDYFDPKNLENTLQHKMFKNLFFAGQINGTTGYEEAAAQGLIAGINAALFSNNQKMWYPSSQESYIGVLLEDLTNNGIEEPYRMFTSRAENRLYLREDNAVFRLSEIGYNLNILSKKKYNYFLNKKKNIDYEYYKLKNIYCKIYKKNAIELLKMNNFSYNTLIENNLIEKNLNLDENSINYIVNEIKYSGYINQINRKKNTEILNLKLNNINYLKIDGLSNEIKEKLIAKKPSNFSELLKTPSITPAGVNAIIIYLKKNKNENNFN